MGSIHFRCGVVLLSLLTLFFGATPQVAYSAEWEMSQDYSDVQTFLYALKAQYPQRVEVFTLGQGDDGRTIEGIRIGKGAHKTLVVATHHGNEYGSTEVAKAIALALAENPIPGQTVAIIPVLNLSGFDRRSRNERNRAGKNVDPNRDYPGPCKPDLPSFQLKSTQLLADWINQESIIASATLHTYYPGVLYPWGISTREISTPYDAKFIELGQAATQESGYAVGNSTELLYAADGTFEDYAFWRHGIWSLLFELGHSHRPTQAEVERMIEVNVPGLRRFLEMAPLARARDHGFTGECQTQLRAFDRKDE